MHLLHNIFMIATAAVCAIATISPSNAQTTNTSYIKKLGQDFDVRSGARILVDEVRSGRVILPDADTPVPALPAVPQVQLRGDNVQVNDPTMDYVQIFPGLRPFVYATQSETSAAGFGRNIVVTYNNSAGMHVALFNGGPSVFIDRLLFSGYSVSNDGGSTWKSAFMPPAAGAFQTFGDPSVGVDRRGVFYFATLGANASGASTIQVNKSTNGGDTWSPATIVQQDDGSDKEWLAVGPDPVQKNRDNVYVSWTSFQATACELRFGRSVDGGQTWTAKTILVPSADPDPTHPQNCLQSSNIVVDSMTGTIYIPFLRYSYSDQDFIQMLVSDNAGETFRFARFDAPGAPSPTLLPVTEPGAFTECGATRISATRFSVNLRLTIHGPATASPGLTGLPRYINATRILTQPAAAARNGRVYLAWNNSTSQFYGDPSSGSNILFTSSSDGGNTWMAPMMVNPVVAGDRHHVMPALAIDNDPNDVHITYYTQHTNSTMDLDMANSHDGGATFPANRTVRVTGTSFSLPPTNIPIPSASNPFATTNYDRLVQQCYALGEYQSVTTANGSVYAAWGDTRNLITEPVNALDPISGQTHSQEDVFFQKVKAQ